MKLGTPGGVFRCCQVCCKDRTCELVVVLCLSRMLQGPYSSLDRDRDRPLIRLPFASFTVGTVLLPLTGFIACLFISLMYHLEDATYTHCQVGRHTVQKILTWKSARRREPSEEATVSVCLFLFFYSSFDLQLNSGTNRRWKK